MGANPGKIRLSPRGAKEPILTAILHPISVRLLNRNAVSPLPLPMPSFAPCQGSGEVRTRFFCTSPPNPVSSCWMELDVPVLIESHHAIVSAGRVYDTPHAGTESPKSKAWLLLQTVEEKKHPARVGHPFLLVVGTFGLVLDVILEHALEPCRLVHADKSGGRCFSLLAAG